MRRIVSSLILLALLVGLIALIVGIVKWVGGILSAENEKNISRTVAERVEIDACQPADLSLTVTPSQTKIAEGASMSVSLVILNAGEKECSFSLADLDVTLGNSERDVWTPTACAQDQRLLLLAPEQPWETSFAWDGALWKDCERQMINVASDNDDGSQNTKSIAATPPEGTYDLVVSVAGLKRPITEVITVQ